MQRYALWKASVTDIPTRKMGSIATTLKLEPLFESLYYVVGQQSANEEVANCIDDYFVFGETKPLVLSFSESSGHDS